MKKKTVLKDAGVLLIVLAMVLSTVLIVAGNTIKNDEKTETMDSEKVVEMKSIEGSEIFSQLFDRYTMTCVPAFGYYRDGDSLRACVSADGGLSWNVAGSDSKDTNMAGSLNNDLILNEGFEGGIMPPTGWSVVNHGTDAWVISSSAHTGNYAAEHTGTGGMGSTLTSPTIIFEYASSLILEFWYSITDPESINLEIYDGEAWYSLLIDLEVTGTYNLAKIDITDCVNTAVAIQFKIFDYHQSTFRLDDIVIYDGGAFSGDVDPIGGAVITETSDGYVISGSGEYGALFTPDPSYKGFTNTIDLSDIPEGGKIGMEYFTLGDTFMFEIEIENEIDALSKSAGVYPVGFNGTASGAPSVWGGRKGKTIFDEELTGPRCGAFKVTDKGVYPVGFNGTASGAPSIIAWDFGDGIEDPDADPDPFEYILDGVTYVVDCVQIRQAGNPNTGVRKCAVTKDDIAYLSSATTNNDQFTVTHVRASDPPNNPNINGPASGKAGEKQTYTLSTIEPNGDLVHYFVQWGDDSGERTCLYRSNDIATVEHTWDVKGDYIIMVKAVDTNGFESDWAELSVTMPRNRAIQRPFLNILENHPYMFPILRQLLGL